MKILHVQHVLDRGGAETMLLQLAREQRRLGHDATICVLHEERPLAARAAEYGIPVVHLNSPRTPLAKIRALRNYLQKQDLQKQRFDILHSHWDVWLATAVAGAITHTPLVHTHHGNQSRRDFIEQRIACWFTPKVVVLTPEIEPFISKWVNVPARKIEVIPNGVEFGDLDAATRVEVEGISPDAPVVGMVARLSPPKDYPTLLRAAQIVAKTRPDIQFLGIGEGQQRDEFERQAAELGLNNFRFLGGRSDVPALLRRMTVNVLSTLSEGLPISLLEAMASGCPCIASDIPPNRFALEDGADGILVPRQDPLALAEAILRLVADPELRNNLIARAYQRSRYFSVERVADDYMNLYARVIAADRRT